GRATGSHAEGFLGGERGYCPVRHTTHGGGPYLRSAGPIRIPITWRSPAIPITSPSFGPEGLPSVCRIFDGDWRHPGAAVLLPAYREPARHEACEEGERRHQGLVRSRI